MRSFENSVTKCTATWAQNHHNFYPLPVPLSVVQDWLILAKIGKVRGILRAHRKRLKPPVFCEKQRF